MLADVDSPEAPREKALLAWIQQFAPYGILTLNTAFQVQTWNHWMEIHSGLDSSQVEGKNLFELFPDLVERRLVNRFERALQGESSVLSTGLHHYLLPLPSPFREAGPSGMLQTARISPLFSEHAVCGLILVIEDVTQRERQAEALSRQNRRQGLLSWALAHLLMTEHPRRAVRQLFFKVAEQLDFDTFLVYLRDLESGQLRLEAIGGIPVEAETDFRVCPFPLEGSDSLRQTLVLNDIQTRQHPEHTLLRKARVSCAVAIPLHANERELGLLCFASWGRALIAPDEVDLVTTIAQYLATALDRENTNRQLHEAKEQLSQHAQLLERRVQERTARLQETIAELETFSYTVAHDLRAPVRAMTGYCELLLEDFADLDPEAKRAVERIGRAAGRMENLTRDLLEFSKVSREEVTLTRVEVEPMIEELAAVRAPLVRQAITVQAPLHPVQAHHGLLRQVLANLIDNAVKFVQPDTPPKITIYSEVVPHSSPNTRSHPLTFNATEHTNETVPHPHPDSSPQHVRIWVRDEGIGIPPEAHQKVFGIFERGVPPDAYEGTGIGLAIVARAMQRMGGTCGVESELEKGSRFWLEFPEV